MHPPPPKKKIGKIFFGQLPCKSRAFSGEYDVKFENFDNFSGKHHVKFGHFVNFSYVYFRAKMSSPKIWLSTYAYVRILSSRSPNEFVHKGSGLQSPATLSACKHAV